ncbi:MAG: SDR family oxidoreductase [Acidimicrobiales bacterium]
MSHRWPWRRALVTGASAGLGAAFARELAAGGAELVLVARNRERLEALARELPVPCDVLVADLADPADVARVAARTAGGDRDGSPVDLLVNNAGFGTVGDFVDRPIEGEERQVAVNVVALQRLTHAAGAAMVARGSGTILNVASVAGFRPAPRSATYGATKAFVVGFSRAVAAELAPRGVAVTCLCPGLTRTEFHQRAGYDTAGYPRWAWQEASTVARAGLRGAAAGKVTVVPGVHNRMSGHLMRLLPDAVLRRADERLRPGTTLGEASGATDTQHVSPPAELQGTRRDPVPEGDR